MLLGSIYRIFLYPRSPYRKFEEIYPPEVAEFVYITDDTYTKKQVLRMEHLVLKVLSFDLAAPTIVQFLTQYFLRQRVCNKVESLSMVSEVILGSFLFAVPFSCV